MREAAIGIITAIVAVAAFSWLRADPPKPATRPVMQVWSGGGSLANPVRNMTPTTQPDPAEKQLETVIDAVFEKAPLADCIRHIKETTGANVWVNWRALEAAGIDRKAEITLDLQRVKAAVALKFLLQDAGGNNIKLAWRCSDGVVTISTAEHLGTDAVTRVYDVRDLVVSIMKDSPFPVERSNGLFGIAGPPSPATTQPTGRGAGWGGVYRGEQLTEQEAMDALVRLIQEIIDPATWRDAGGSVGAIRALRGHLIVTQTLENHEALVGVLDFLRQPVKP